MNATWSSTEMQIIEALTLKVRVFTASQIASCWYAEADESEVVLRMEHLCQAGLVQRRQVYAHPIIPVKPPVFAWSPGHPQPSDEELQRLATHFQSRWTTEEQLFTVFVATPEGAGLFGGYLAEPPAIDQWTHDIHVGEIYTDLVVSNGFEEMRSVLGEGALPKLGHQIRHMKDPDLFVVDENRQAKYVIEFAGAYDFQHCKALHEHCAGKAHRLLKKHFRGKREHLLYPDANGTPYVLV